MGFFSGISSFISGIFMPVASVIDDLHLSDEEQMKLTNALKEIELKALGKMTELEKAKLEAMSKVQVAEAQSPHTITAIWRPVVSVALVSVVILASFGIIPKPDSDFYGLCEIFLGAYTISRGTEKIASRFGR